MDFQGVQTNTISVARGAHVDANIPKYGVLRLARQHGAMAGKAEMSAENGMLTLYFADGASVNLDAR
ncbi:MAG: hypothetical protein WBB25_09455 [Sulfitobacter sp.]